ncbi:uncharacterized protein LOC111694650 [Trichogramma pretiosum]|uniref:uncharacterized protein LOC111694650 n=1 Tax=Trichogramma pretiosum TaxID=7493 RepID=UPI000C718FE4|nr:uncharacterized protein LOC111694650 [Trichogramma pretiosum]
MAKSIDILALFVFFCVITHSLRASPPPIRKGKPPKQSGHVDAPKSSGSIDKEIKAQCKTSQPECKVNVKHMQSRHALLIDSTDHTKFVYPDKFGNVHLKQKQHIHLACSGTGNKFAKIKKQYSTATCLCDDKFFLEGKRYLFDELLCDKTPQYEILSVDKKGDNNQFNVCFKTDVGGTYLTLMQVHHNIKKQRTSFVKSTVPKEAAFQHFENVNDDGTPLKFSPTFMQVNGPKSLDYFYYFASQEQSFETEFPKNVYIQNGQDLIFSRGHLVARADMVYAPAARATYIYLNTHPQWHIINRSNWNKIEEYVRKMAVSLGKVLNTYTGTSPDQLKLEDDETKKDKDVYLSVHEHTEKDKKGREKKVIDKNLPVPLYTFKIVVEPSTKSGVVFVTVNNPYLRDDQLDKHQFCKKVLPLPAEVDVSSNEVTKSGHLHGYSYMCEVSSFLDKTGLRYLFPAEVMSVAHLLSI